MPRRSQVRWRWGGARQHLRRHLILHEPSRDPLWQLPLHAAQTSCTISATSKTQLPNPAIDEAGPCRHALNANIDGKGWERVQDREEGERAHTARSLFTNRSSACRWEDLPWLLNDANSAVHDADKRVLTMSGASLTILSSPLPAARFVCTVLQFYSSDTR